MKNVRTKEQKQKILLARLQIVNFVLLGWIAFLILGLIEVLKL